MDMKTVMEFSVALLTGLATAIPLVIKLVEYTKESVRNRNWSIIVGMVADYMAEAETLFNEGADRKTWCMKMMEAAAVTVDFDIDMTAVSDLIDKLCEMSKIVNGKKEAVVK